VRWPGHIKPGTVINQLFAALDWLPTFVDIAGGPKGDGLKQQIEAGKYTGIVKTTLDGFDQRDLLVGFVRRSRLAGSPRQETRGSCLPGPPRSLGRAGTSTLLPRKCHRKSLDGTFVGSVVEKRP
jgi:hypothetical protein